MSFLKNKLFGVLILIAVIVYVISPLDFVPGPIDDVIVAVIGVALSKRKLLR